MVQKIYSIFSFVTKRIQTLFDSDSFLNKLQKIHSESVRQRTYTIRLSIILFILSWLNTAMIPEVFPIYLSMIMTIGLIILIVRSYISENKIRMDIEKKEFILFEHESVSTHMSKTRGKRSYFLVIQGEKYQIDERQYHQIDLQKKYHIYVAKQSKIVLDFHV